MSRCYFFSIIIFKSIKKKKSKDMFSSCFLKLLVRTIFEIIFVIEFNILYFFFCVYEKKKESCFLYFSYPS